MAKSEHVVGKPSSVRVVLFNLQIRFMVEQSVQNVRSVTHRGVNELCVKRGILIGDVRVENCARIVSVARIDFAPGLRVSTGSEALTIRGRGRPFAPVLSKFNGVLMINDLSQGFCVGLIANVHVAIRLNVDAEIPGHASAMRVIPRLIPSARIVVSSSERSFTASPLRRFVKC